MEENTKSQIDAIAKEIEVKFENVASTNKDEFNALTEKFNELNSRIDAQEVATKKFNESREPKSFKNSLTKAISEGALDALKNGTARSAKFDIKAGDMTTANSYTGEVIPADRVAGYKFDPTRSTHVRQLIPTGSTASDVVRFVKESAYDNGAAATAEGSTIPQSDFDFTASDANVQKIATYFRISEEMLADTPQLTSYLSSRAPEKLLEVEDTQILSGTGVAPQLSGIITDSTDFAAGGFANAIESANEFDVLTVAMNQLALANYQANYIMINPTDFHKILLLKDSNNNYLKDQWYQGLEPRINGVPVVLSTAITSDKYLIGNFSVGTQLWIRDNVSVEFFREDGTNVRDGFVTCRVMERVALTNYLPNAFVNGDFSVDKAALETA